MSMNHNQRGVAGTVAIALLVAALFGGCMYFS